MTSTYHPGVHRFSVFVVGWTVLLFVAGALVTSKDAALSVTDWPKSHGAWIPPLATLQGSDLFEFSHRVVAGGLGILTLALAVLLWVKEKRLWLRWLGCAADRPRPRRFTAGGHRDETGDGNQRWDPGRPAKACRAFWLQVHHASRSKCPELIPLNQGLVVIT